MKKDNVFQKYIEVFNLVHVPIFVVDLKGDPVGANDTFCALLRASKDEIIGQNISQMFPGLIWNRDIGVYRNVIFYRKDGSGVSVSIITLALKDRKGSLVGYGVFFQDVSFPEKKAEGKTLAEDMNKIILEHLPQRIFVKDRNLVYICCSKNYAADCGYLPEDMIGKDDYEFFPRELADKYRAFDRKIMSSGETMEFDEPYVYSGKEFIVHTVKIPINDEKGNVKWILGIFWDITEQKKAELNISKLKQQMEFILDSTGTRLDIIDSEYNICYVGARWERIYGNFAGKKCYEYFMQRKSVCPGCTIPKSLETKNVVVGEYRLPKEGNRPVQVTSIPFQDKNGKWLIAEVKVDISERKKYEMKIDKERKKLESIMDNMQDGVVITDMKGMIIDLNNAAAEQYGDTKENIIGKFLWKIYIAEERDLLKALSAVEKISAEEIVGNQDYLAKRKDGTTFPVSVNMSLLKNGESCPEGIIVVCRDISRSKKMEGELKERLKELEIFYDAAVEREFRIKELRDKVDLLSKKLEEKSKGQ